MYLEVSHQASLGLLASHAALNALLKKTEKPLRGTKGQGRRQYVHMFMDMKGRGFVSECFPLALESLEWRSRGGGGIVGNMKDVRTENKWPQVPNKHRTTTRKTRIIAIRDAIIHLQVNP